MPTAHHEPVTVTEADARTARSAAEKVAKYGHASARVHIRRGRSREETVALPAPAVQLLVEILDEMARGNPVAVFPLQAELTTQQAAEALNVSRPYLVKLLDQGKVPYRRVGNRRKVRVSDLLTFKRLDDADRSAAAAELSAEAQRLGLGY